MKTTFELIYDVVRKIPRGCVATYGQIATLAGNPRWSRVVGYALHVNPEPGVIPCHRVVNRLGETSSAFAFGGAELAMKTVNQVFGMNITKYVVVDFTSVVSLVDAIGGIDVDITEQEMNHITRGIGQCRVCLEIHA